jgi:hypothetical protein
MQFAGRNENTRSSPIGESSLRGKRAALFVEILEDEMTPAVIGAIRHSRYEKDLERCWWDWMDKRYESSDGRFECIRDILAGNEAGGAGRPS